MQTAFLPLPTPCLLTNNSSATTRTLQPDPSHRRPNQACPNRIAGIGIVAAARDGTWCIFKLTALLTPMVREGVCKLVQVAAVDCLFVWLRTTFQTKWPRSRRH